MSVIKHNIVFIITLNNNPTLVAVRQNIDFTFNLFMSFFSDMRSIKKNK